MGGGDVKLCIVCLLCFGLMPLLWASLFSGAFCIMQLVRKKIKKDDTIAFGPFICAGIALYLAFY